MKNKILKISVAIAYLAMIFVNFLANSLPINNRSTGAISDDYPNLFAPAGITFSIWGLIYLMLGAFVVYQFLYKSKKSSELINKINPYFLATSLANISWLFAWHYDYIGLSVGIMAVFLILLIKIADILRTQKLQTKENILIKTPFSLYFGWITVATIANISVFLVSINWNGFGIADNIWTIIILVIGAIIGILRLIKDKNTVYGLVFLWAYSGILYKHLSVTGFNSDYPIIIFTLIACLFAFVFFIGRNIYLQRKSTTCF